jgi:hypothetical protein
MKSIQSKHKADLLKISSKLGELHRLIAGNRTTKHWVEIDVRGGGGETVEVSIEFRCTFDPSLADEISALFSNTDLA